jgi:hypothetical protein
MRHSQEGGLFGALAHSAARIHGHVDLIAQINSRYDSRSKLHSWPGTHGSKAKIANRYIVSI